VVARARAFAAEAHAGQRYGDEPYTAHLDEVAARVQPFGELHQTVAYLHDVVEDTPTTLPEVEALFGDLVARCVALLTDEPGDSRKARKQLTHAKLGCVDAAAEEAVALVVKAADRLCNVERCVLHEDRGLLRMYRREHREFRRAVYRPGLADGLWAELSTLIAP